MAVQEGVGSPGHMAFSVADLFWLFPFQMSVSKRARKASSDLDQASMSPSEEENSESSSESEKTSDQVGAAGQTQGRCTRRDAQAGPRGGWQASGPRIQLPSLLPGLHP